MMACSSMPMNRTDRPGSYPSGMPVRRSPITPWSFSPVRMTRIEVVFAAVTGILSQGKMGTPRHACSTRPSTVAGSG